MSELWAVSSAIEDAAYELEAQGELADYQRRVAIAIGEAALAEDRKETMRCGAAA